MKTNRMLEKARVFYKIKIKSNGMRVDFPSPLPAIKAEHLPDALSSSTVDSHMILDLTRRAKHVFGSNVRCHRFISKPRKPIAPSPIIVI